MPKKPPRPRLVSVTAANVTLLMRVDQAKLFHKALSEALMDDAQTRDDDGLPATCRIIHNACSCLQVRVGVRPGDKPIRPAELTEFVELFKRK